MPVRTCRGCGRKVPQAELLRFVLVGAALIEDQQTMLVGRGVYCCNNPTCTKRLAKRRRPRNRTEHTGRITEEGSV